MSGKDEFECDFKWRKGDIGIRASTKNDRNAEIVCYQRDDEGRETCYTLAWFVPDDEGYNIETVGRRLTEAMLEYHIPYEDFVKAMNSAMKILDEFHSLQDQLKC